MSYDLDAFRVPSGISAEEFLESGAREELAEDDSPPTEAEWTAMDRAARALLAVDPSANRSDGDDSIEVNADAIQVGIYAREAGISVPYWFEGAEAEAAMERVFTYARVLAATLGFTVWDPQTGAIVDTAAPDRAAAAGILDDISGRMDEIARTPRRPWWKIWG